MQFGGGRGRRAREKTAAWVSEVEPLGVSRSLWGDLYHFLLTASWLRVLLLVAAGYLAVNGLFALLYLAGGPGSITDMRDGSFSDAFFFSVQTIATIGYGNMHPHTLYTNLLASVEPLVGLLGFAMATGLMFAKFSRPTARLRFSRWAIIAPHNGQKTLSFRVANRRHNLIHEARVHAVWLRTESAPEGVTLRRVHDLALVRSETPMFQLTWTVMHVIDESSPLVAYSREEFTRASADFELVITISGTDETFSQTVHDRHHYLPGDIKLDARFADVLGVTRDGRRTVNYEKFDDIVPLTNGILGVDGRGSRDSR